MADNTDTAGTGVTVPRPQASLRQMTTSTPETLRAVGIVVQNGEAILMEVATPLLLLDAIGYAAAKRDQALAQAQESLTQQKLEAAEESTDTAAFYDAWIDSPDQRRELARAIGDPYLLMRQIAGPKDLRLCTEEAFAVHVDFLLRASAFAKHIPEVVPEGMVERVAGRRSGASEAELATVTENIDEIIMRQMEERASPTSFLLITDNSLGGSPILYGSQTLKAQIRHTGHVVMGKSCDSEETLHEVIARVMIQLATIRQKQALSESTANGETATRSQDALRRRLDALIAKNSACVVASDTEATKAAEKKSAPAQRSSAP